MSTIALTSPPAFGTSAHRAPRPLSRVISLLGAILLASAFLVVGGASSPASAAVTSQCDGEFNVGGQGMNCQVTVENFLNIATGVASSRVTTLACNGGALVDPLPTCIGPTVTEFTELTTEVDQCNGSANGGGSSLLCSIVVTNTITGSATTFAAPINQCNGSLTTGDVRACSPDPATTDASLDGVTQCNGSVNGGGGSMTCTVSTRTTSNSAFGFIANQCNDSDNGGGATTVCSVDISNVIVPAADTGGDTGGGTGGDTGGGTGGTGGGTPTATPDELARTGALETGALVAVPLAALLLGALLIGARRSRRDGLTTGS